MSDEAPAGLLGQLRAVLLYRDRELRSTWERSLPFGDAIGDRWERAARLGFGEGSSVYDSCVLLGDVRVGDHTWIGPFTLLDGSGGGLVIGSHCSISAGVHLYTHDTVLRSLSGGVLDAQRSPTAVGDRTYLGSQVVVARGVTIGSHCVVGANSFVNDDVPHRAVVAGSPARVIGRVEGDGETVRIVYERPTDG